MSDDMLEGAAVFVLIFLVLFVCCLLLFSTLGSSDNKPAVQIQCATKGAQPHERDTKNGLYATVWCVKDGRVVP